MAVRKKTRKRKAKAAPKTRRGPRDPSWKPTGPKPRNGQTALTAFRLPERLIAAVNQAADTAGVSRTQIVTDVLLQSFPLPDEEPASAFD